MTQTLTISMKLNNGKTHGINLLDPKNNLTLAEVQAVATQIVNKQFLMWYDSDTGDEIKATALDKAYIRTVEVQYLS